MAAYVPYKYNPAEMPPQEMEATFVGRHHILNRLIDAVREQTHTDTLQHYLLLGPRGIGKTTLLLMLYRHIKTTPNLAAHWIPVQYREEEFYVYTFRDLLALALENLAASENIPEAGAILAEAEMEPDDDQSLAKILDGLKNISAIYQKRILLLIDNFDLIVPNQDTDKHAFRKLLMTASHLMVVGTSVRQFEDIAKHGDPFFNFFSPIPVENLADDEIQQLLRTRAERDGNADFLQYFNRYAEKIRAITYLTGGNPRLVMMLYEVFSRKRIEHVVQALRETIDNLTPLLKDVLENLPPQQSKILDALMRLGGVASPSDIAKRARLPLNAVTTQIRRLRDTRLIDIQGEGRGKPALCRVRDQMLKTWYQMRYLRPARRRVEMLVEFLRAWFSIEERTKELTTLTQEFETALASGRQIYARETAVALDYFAASIEEPAARSQYIQRTAESYAALGDLREAALTLAESQFPEERSETRYEISGYTELGNMLGQKGDLSQASAAYQEVLERDSQNIPAKMGLGSCAVISGNYQEALKLFSDVIQSDDAPVEQVAKALINRGVSKGLIGDITGEIEDYDAIIELKNAPSDFIVHAFFYRGISKKQLGDIAGSIEDYTAIVKMEGASVNMIAKTLLNRGVSKRQLNDIKGAIEDFTAVIELEGAPIEQVAGALTNRGVRKGQLGDIKGEIEDYNTVIELENAPIEQVAKALFNRGGNKRKLNDVKGAIEDLTTVIELKNAPIVFIANALINRGMIKGQLGDHKGEIEDYTTLIQLDDAPVEQVAKALINRGAEYGERNDLIAAFKDFDQVVNLAGISDQMRLSALLNRGIAHEKLSNMTAALTDYTQCALSRASVEIVHGGLSRLIVLYSKHKRAAEARTWIARIGELEPEDTSLEQQLDMRIALITSVAQTASFDLAVDLLDALLGATANADLREKLAFLKPGLAFAQTGDETLLTKLPEEEQAIARRIASALTGHRNPPANPG